MTIQTLKKWGVLACGAAGLLTFGLWYNHQPAALASPSAFPLLPGFPLTAPTNIEFTSTNVADLDGNGDLELLTADGRGQVWAWHHDGSVLPGFPLSTRIDACPAEERINGPLAVGNVVGDSKPEIIAGTRGCNVFDGLRGRVYVWNHAGVLQPGWPREIDWNVQYNPEGNAEVYSIVLANLTGDSKLEIIAGTNNSTPDVPPGRDGVDTRNLYAWTGDGQIMSGFPVWHRTGGIWGAPAAANVTGGPLSEIMVGRDQVYFYIYNAQAGYVDSRYPVRTSLREADANSQWGTFKYGEFTRGAPTVGDIDRDGAAEIVVPSTFRDPAQAHGVVGNSLFVFNVNGTRQPGWEVAPEFPDKLSDFFSPLYAASLADLNDNGDLEIIVPYGDGIVRVFRPNGQLLWSYNYAQGKILFASEAAVGDITGDGRPDIVFGTYNPDPAFANDTRLIALNHLGQLIPGFPLTLPNEDGDKQGVRGAPTITDLDGDCDVDIIATGWRGNVYAWDLETPYFPNKMPWPTARHDNLRTGWYDGPQLHNSSCSNWGYLVMPIFVDYDEPATSTPTPTATPTETATPSPTPTPTPEP